MKGGSNFTERLTRRILLGALLPILSFIGCSLTPPSNSASLVTTCNIPSDQSGTISGQWLTKPIPLAFHQGDFTQEEITEMTASIDTWNKFFTGSKKFNIFDYGGTNGSIRTSNQANPTDTLCANGILTAGTFNGNVVVYKLGRWPSAYQQNAMALTRYCKTNATPYNRFYMAIMEINYQEYFIQGKKIPDLQSIFLHELGHTLGLDHSCATSAQAGFPNCTGSGIDTNYLIAVMFPSFSFDNSGNGQQKRTLQKNDQGRANCLY